MRLALAFLSLTLLAWPAAGRAQGTDSSPTAHDARTYGTSAKTFVSLSYAQFTPVGSTSFFAMASAPGGTVYRNTNVIGGQRMLSGVSSPKGLS